MLDNLSLRLAGFLCRRGVLPEKEEALYSYAIHILFATLGTSLSILLIGAFLGVLIETLVFLTVFAIVREYAGGFHTTDGKCFVSSVLTAAVYILLIRFVPVEYMLFPALAVMLASDILIFRYAPIASENKPLDEEEVKLYRKKARVFAVVFSAAALVLVLLGLSIYGTAVMYGISLSAVSLVLGVLDR